MKIAFFTEAGYTGKVPRDHNNLRTDLAWVCALQANHYPLHMIKQLSDKQYDIGIAVLPKNKEPFLGLNVAEELQRTCKVCVIQQESHHMQWQDNPVAHQVWYINNLSQVDFIFVHNDIDVEYYSGLVNKICEKMPSLLITDSIKEDKDKMDAVIIGGNLVSIYRGIDSFMVAREYNLPIYNISSGRKQDKEEEMGINPIPWTLWSQWMYNLSKFKYAVQFGIGAAGSFNLNCAYLGIPCIGLKALETQRLCFPDLSIGDVDMKGGKELTYKLKKDKDFYNHCSKTAKENFKKHFAEEKFLNTVNNIFEKHYKIKYS